MLSAAIAYQILNWESPQSVQKVTAVLEKHPWYAHQWQARLQDVPAADHGRVLFMQQQGRQMIFAPKTRFKIGRLGITSTSHSNPRRNRRTCKSEIPSQ
jgi:hypothetical protein